jgi:hypothetical protein
MEFRKAAGVGSFATFTSTWAFSRVLFSAKYTLSPA